MTNTQDIIKLPPLLQLPPVNLSEIHPHAAERYLRFLQELFGTVALDQIIEGDLTEAERISRKECTDAIVTWLQNCSQEASEGALIVYPYSTTVNYYMHNLKTLLGAIYKRKLDKKRLESENKRRLAVLEEIAPPLDDAKKYLNKEEQRKFLDSIPGAIDAYLETGETGMSLVPNIWLLNSKASHYSRWIWGIEDRRKKETRQKQAEIEHDQYLDRLSAAVEEFKRELAKSKKPKSDYPPELEKYQPDSWCALELPGAQEIQNLAEGKILERLPSILAELTKWELSWQVRVMPKAVYEAADIPCLRWHFRAYIAVTAMLELKKCEIRKSRPAGYTVEVQAEGEKLGTIYLGPAKWLIPGGFQTPLSLLRVLREGGLEGPGVTVIEHVPPFTAYDIQGFDEEIEVCKEFCTFIRDIAKQKPLAQALSDVGLIDDDTASLVKSRWDQPLPINSDSDGVGSELQAVVEKLAELGFAEADAKKAAQTAVFPPGATVEDKVKIILQGPYGKTV